MASSAPSKTKLGLPREDVEELLMMMCLEKSTTEFDKTKEGGSLLGEVRHWKPFQESFDKLVSKGCSPYILLRGLDFLLRTEKQQTSLQLPGKREIRSLETCLRKGAERIVAFEKKYDEAHCAMVFSHFVCGQSASRDADRFYWNRMDTPRHAKTPCLAEKMLAYAEMLRAWWTPRSDALKTSASVHNCVYAKVATGQPQFTIVAELHSSFLGRCIEPDTLRKNFLRFQRRNRKFYLYLLAELAADHGSCLPVESVDWPILFSRAADRSK